MRNIKELINNPFKVFQNLSLEDIEIKENKQNNIIVRRYLRKFEQEHKKYNLFYASCSKIYLKE